MSDSGYRYEGETPRPTIVVDGTWSPNRTDPPDEATRQRYVEHMRTTSLTDDEVAIHAEALKYAAGYDVHCPIVRLESVGLYQQRLGTHASESGCVVAARRRDAVHGAKWVRIEPIPFLAGDVVGADHERVYIVRDGAVSVYPWRPAP